jgi:hypothetical protein
MMSAGLVGISQRVAMSWLPVSPAKLTLQNNFPNNINFHQVKVSMTVIPSNIVRTKSHIFIAVVSKTDT